MKQKSERNLVIKIVKQKTEKKDKIKKMSARPWTRNEHKTKKKEDHITE